MMTNWLFSDFDGTFRNDANFGIREEDLVFAKNWQKAGHKFVIATGRHHLATLNYLKEKGFEPDFFVGNTGALVHSGQGELISAQLFNQTAQKTLLKFLESFENRFEAVIFTTIEAEEILKCGSLTPEQKKRFAIPRSKYTSYSQLSTLGLVGIKLLCDSQTWKEVCDFISQTKLPFATVRNNLQVLSVGEIHATFVNKAQGIEILCQYAKIDPENVYIAGDDINDLPMFKKFSKTFIIAQPYNQEIRNQAQTTINGLAEIQNFINLELPKNS